MTTYKVNLRPSNTAIEVEEGKNLLEALRENDIYIKSSCGGHATCSDCICKVVHGEDNFESPPFAELKLLGNVFHITKERLLCQTKIVGDVTIDISKHDKVSDEEKLRAKTKPISNKYAAKKPATKVRTKDDFAKIKEERYQQRLKNNQNEASWEKHWEKGQSETSEKKVGGEKRPRYFDSDKAQELTKRDIEERDRKREFFKTYVPKKGSKDFKREERSGSIDKKSEDKKNEKDFKKFRGD